MGDPWETYALVLYTRGRPMGDPWAIIINPQKIHGRSLGDQLATDVPALEPTGVPWGSHGFLVDVPWESLGSNI